MKKIFFDETIIGFLSRDESELEVCASAKAKFDEKTSRVLVELDCGICPTDPRSGVAAFHPAWLPKRHVATGRAQINNASGLAKMFFHQWISHVRQSVPMPIHS
jgi:hypothetical protein